jgi:hypothetical protein
VSTRTGWQRRGRGGSDLKADDLVDVREELDGLGAVVHGGRPHHAHIPESVANLCNQDAKLVQEALSLLVHTEFADVSDEV